MFRLFFLQLISPLLHFWFVTGLQDPYLQEQPQLQTNNVFFCHKCLRTYASKYTLFRHLKLECGVTPQFQCHICNKRFKRKYQITDHIKTHHWVSYIMFLEVDKSLYFIVLQIKSYLYYIRCCEYSWIFSLFVELCFVTFK